MRFLQILALGAPLAAAIAFTSPTKGSSLTRGAPVALTWDFVVTDPEIFSIYLVEFVTWPPFYTPLALNVDTTAGTTTVRVPCEINDSAGYQFNAINGTNTYIIYAQTSRVTITGASCVDPTPPEQPICGPASVLTDTVRGPFSSTYAPGGRVAGPPGSSNLPANSGTGLALLASTDPAGLEQAVDPQCPSTIGWNGDYNKPVVLNEPLKVARGVDPKPRGKRVAKNRILGGNGEA